MPEFTIDPARYANINLQKGAHDTPDDGMCLMEAAAYLAGENHTDQPLCVSPILATFGRNLNDVLPNDRRQELKGLIPSMLGTDGDGLDHTRSYMSLDWLVRSWLPTWMDLIPDYRGNARYIRRLGCIRDAASCRDSYPAVRQVWTRSEASLHPGIPSRGWSSAGYSAYCTSWFDTEVYVGPRSLPIIAWKAGCKLSSGIADLVLVEEAISELQLSAIDLFAEMIKAPR